MGEFSKGEVCGLCEVEHPQLEGGGPVLLKFNLHVDHAGILLGCKSGFDSARVGPEILCFSQATK